MFRKVVLYLSAFLPMLFVMWVKELLVMVEMVLTKPEEYSWEDIYTNKYLIAVVVFIVLIAISTGVLLYRNRKVSVYTIQLESVKNKTAEYYLAYYSLFILALMGFSLVSPVDLVILGLLIVILGIVYIKNDLFFINPTINIFKSYIYEVEYKQGEEIISKLIISKEKIDKKDTIELEVSEFEFTFLRKKYESKYKDEN